MKLGILGFAHSHVGMYIAEWRKTGAMELTAGWDHDVKRAAESGLPVCQTIAELLGQVEAVVIAAETSRHAELVEQAAAAGKAIILQKPLALTLADADRIVAAVRNVPFTLAWQMRVDPHNVQLKSLLATGAFGKVCMLRRRHGLPTQTWPDFAKTWHVQPELNRDVFADDAAHPLDFLYWLRGMPVSVSAELGTLVNPAIVNDTGIAVLRFADGSLGEVSCSFVAVAGENVTEVICERGVIIQNYGDVPSCNSPRPPGAGPQLKWFLDGKWHASELPEIKNHGERIAGLAAPLAEFLHGKRPPIATAAEGRDVLRLVLACYESDQQGKRINL
ncbi:MAG: Myo-inositol 2-dehydrogenase [Verrucomicrobiae bacterium]|nr:Myo-inositol 2-dehydrogenase [Verrucomicrobiae bacterium]